MYGVWVGTEWMRVAVLRNCISIVYMRVNCVGTRVINYASAHHYMACVKQNTAGQMTVPMLHVGKRESEFPNIFYIFWKL